MDQRMQLGAGCADAEGNIIGEGVDALFGQELLRMINFAGLEEGVHLPDERRVIDNIGDPVIDIGADQVAADAHLNAIVGKVRTTDRALRVPLDIDPCGLHLALPLFRATVDAFFSVSQNAVRQRFFPACARDADRKDVFLPRFLPPIAALHHPEK